MLLALGVLAAASGGAQVQSGQSLLGDAFTGGASPAPVLTLNSGAPSFPCLTASPGGSPAPTTIQNCNLAAPDPAGQGALRFTDSGEQQASAIVYETSIPTAQGLTMSFRQFQYGGHGLDGPGSPGGADGLSFFLAVAPPQPQTLGPQGGALGYASFFSSEGLPGAWLGIGLDAFGNFSNPDFGGAACPRPSWAGFAANQIAVRGPGHGTTGYCLIASSIERGDDNPVGEVGVSLRGDTRAASMRTIQVVIDPETSTYMVSIDPDGGTNFVPAAFGPLPTAYYDPASGTLVSGIPPRITFGFAASTGTATDVHEITSLAAATLNGAVPVLGLTKTSSVTGTVAPGAAFDYVITARVDGTVNEAQPLTVRVSDELPAGLTIAGGIAAPSWMCIPSSPSSFDCTYTNPAPIPPGTVRPPITVPVVLASDVADGTALTNTATVLSSDAARPASASTTVTVSAAPPLTIQTVSLPTGQVGVSYPVTTLTATGGTPPLTWSVVAGGLPAGLSLSTAGAISGTPTSAGTFAVTIRATDSASTIASRAFNITIGAALTITTASLPNGTVGVAYPSTSLTATGGSGTRTWSVAAGLLPAGLTMSAAGVITGTPTATGAFSFTARVIDSAGGSNTRALSITVSAVPLSIATTTLPAGRTGTAYAAVLGATGGVLPYSWTRASGTLPPGVTLTPGGFLTGTPTTAGTFTFTVRVTDAAQATATRGFSIAVSQLAITTTSIPSGQVLRAYSTTLRAIGGTGALRWNLLSGALPNGVVLLPTGVIVGLPIQAGSFSVVVRVVDGSGAAATQALTLTVAPAPSIITTLGLPGGEVGLAYAATLSAAGGSAPLVWSVAAGSLPAGLALLPTGAIGGVPIAAGTRTFTVRVTDGADASSTRVLSIAIAPAVAVSTAALPGGGVGLPYSATLTRSGGVAPVTWSVAAGALPPGLSMSSRGIIAGTPTATGTYTFTARVVDALGVAATRAFSIPVAPRPEKAYVVNQSGTCLRPIFNCRSELVSFDTRTGSVVRRIDVDKRFIAMEASPDGARLFVQTLSNNGSVVELHLIDTASDTLVRSRTLPTSGGEMGVAPDGSALYLLSRSLTTLRTLVLDPATLAVRRSYVLWSGSYANPTGHAISTDGRRQYVVMWGLIPDDTHLVVADPVAGVVLQTVHLPALSATAAYLTPNGGRLLIPFQSQTGARQRGILDFSTASMAVADVIPIDHLSSASRMVVPDDSRFFTAPWSAGNYYSLDEYSLVSNSRLRSIQVTGFTDGLELNAARTDVLTTIGLRLTSIDLATGTERVVATLSNQLGQVWLGAVSREGR